MSMASKCIVKLRGIKAAAPLMRALENPREAQEKLLRRMLQKNADTVFGREHGFDKIQTPAEYVNAVPIRNYEGFRPYVERIVQGEKAVLTKDSLFMFATTSGTTAKPKLIPITNTFKENLASMTRIWLHWASRDHDAMLSQSGLSIVSPAIEGATATGQIIGMLNVE